MRRADRGPGLRGVLGEREQRQVVGRDQAHVRELVEVEDVVPVGALADEYGYEPRSPRPTGYTAQSAWAEVQIEAGVPEARCANDITAGRGP